MDSMQAFVINQGHLNDRRRVFDWDEAARLIAERKPQTASAGLQGDWEYTGGDIYRDGQMVPHEETYTYLASNWAIPELDLDGDVSECWRYEDNSPGWGPKTYWPESAIDILNGADS